MSRKEKDFLNYLDLLQDNVLLHKNSSSKIINIARSYYLAFKYQAETYNLNLQVPQVFMDENLHINFKWWKGNYELEVEITEKDSYYYFNHFRKDKTELIWEKHYEPLQPPYGIPTDIYNKVLLFTEEIQ